MSTRFDIISSSKQQTAREKAQRRIARDRRSSAALRAIAENLDGAYITKRLAPKIHDLVPDAKRVYIYQNSYSPVLYANIDFTSSHDPETNLELAIGCADNRRLNGAELLKKADYYEMDAMEHENTLARMERLVQQYNSLAEQYAEIASPLRDLFDDLPYPDWDAQRRAEATVTPEQFLASIGETLPA